MPSRLRASVGLNAAVDAFAIARVGGANRGDQVEAGDEVENDEGGDEDGGAEQGQPQGGAEALAAPADQRRPGADREQRVGEEGGGGEGAGAERLVRGPSGGEADRGEDAERGEERVGRGRPVEQRGGDEDEEERRGACLGLGEEL